MSLLDRAFKLVHRLFPARVARAHCDIPCGIYDPHMAQIAALTVVRMVQMIQDTKNEDHTGYTAQISRLTKVKEEHAELAKHELRVLWGDYFKPEHLQQFPDLHDKFWKAMKAASLSRQRVDMQAAQDLLAATQDIAEVFWKTKGVATKRLPSHQTAGGELVYPAS